MGLAGAESRRLSSRTIDTGFCCAAMSYLNVFCLDRSLICIGPRRGLSAGGEEKGTSPKRWGDRLFMGRRTTLEKSRDLDGERFLEAETPMEKFSQWRFFRGSSSSHHSSLSSLVHSHFSSVLNIAALMLSLETSRTVWCVKPITFPEHGLLIHIAKNAWFCE